MFFWVQSIARLEEVQQKGSSCPNRCPCGLVYLDQSRVLKVAKFGVGSNVWIRERNDYSTVIPHREHRSVEGHVKRLVVKNAQLFS